MGVLARKFFRDLTVSALIAADTVAGARVYTPGDWPTNKENMPAILVTTPHDIKRSITKQNPNFNTVVTVAVDIRVERDDSTDASKGGGGQAAQDALDLGAYQIEQAILTNYEIIRHVQQVAFVETKSGVDSEQGKHVGQAIVAFGFELYEGQEDFTAPINPPDIKEVIIVVDTKQPVDKLGTYPDPEAPDYTPAAAPRTEGPDGRAEAIVKATNLDQ